MGDGINEVSGTIFFSSFLPLVLPFFLHTEFISFTFSAQCIMAAVCSCHSLDQDCVRARYSARAWAGAGCRAAVTLSSGSGSPIIAAHARAEL